MLGITIYDDNMRFVEKLEDTAHCEAANTGTNVDTETSSRFSFTKENFNHILHILMTGDSIYCFCGMETRKVVEA